MTDNKKIRREEKAQQLAQALRDNLRRRKQGSDAAKDESAADQRARD